MPWRALEMRYVLIQDTITHGKQILYGLHDQTDTERSLFYYPSVRLSVYHSLITSHFHCVPLLNQRMHVFLGTHFVNA